MLRMMIWSGLIGAGIVGSAFLAAPHVVPRIVRHIDEANWAAEYKRNFVQYHFYSRLPDGHYLIDERGDRLRFDSKEAAKAYAAEYDRLDRAER